MFRKGRLIGFLLAAVFLGIVARNVNLADLAAAFRRSGASLYLLLFQDSHYSARDTCPADKRLTPI